MAANGQRVSTISCWRARSELLSSTSFLFFNLMQFLFEWISLAREKKKNVRVASSTQCGWCWYEVHFYQSANLELNGMASCELRTFTLEHVWMCVFFLLPPDMAECRRSGCPWQEQVCNICKSGANQKAPQKLVAWHGMNAVKVISISGKAVLPATKKKNVCTAIYVSCYIYRDYVVLIWMQLHFVYSLLRCCMRWQRSNRINMNNWNVRLNAVRQ